MPLRSASLAALCALCLAVAGCGDEPERVTAASLEGQAFASTSATGTPLTDDATATLEFADGRLAASAGCNTIAGPYSIVAGVLKQGQGARTQMSCGPVVDAQETWLADFLGRGARVTKLEHTLTLSAGDAKVVFRTAKPSGPPPITGTLWTLATIHLRNGRKTDAPVVRPPTLQLSQDDRAAIFTGCNRGGGPAKVDDQGFVTFGPIGMTEMACPEPRDALEQAVLKVLDGKVAAGFSGKGDLTLVKDGDALIFRAP